MSFRVRLGKVLQVGEAIDASVYWSHCLAITRLWVATRIEMVGALLLPITLALLLLLPVVTSEPASTARTWVVMVIIVAEVVALSL